MPRPVKGPSQPGGGEDSAEAEETGGAEGAGADRDACCFCWCCCCSCSCLAPQGEDSPTSSRKNSHTTRTEDCTDSEATSGRAGADEVLAWGRSFERLVRSPTGRAHFRHFLRGEFSEDNLLFWLACEELRVGTDEASLPERMRTIYEEYISILSPREGSRRMIYATVCAGKPRLARPRSHQRGDGGAGREHVRRGAAADLHAHAEGLVSALPRLRALPLAAPGRPRQEHGSRLAVRGRQPHGGQAVNGTLLKSLFCRDSRPINPRRRYHGI